MFHSSYISEQGERETDEGRNKRNNRHKEENKYNILSMKEVSGKSKNQRNEDVQMKKKGDEEWKEEGRKEGRKEGREE